jgi:hypothetical protein
MSVTPKGFGREIDLEYKIPEELKIKPIVVSDMRGVFLLLIIGLSLAIIGFIFEILHYYLMIIIEDYSGCLQIIRHHLVRFRHKLVRFRHNLV